MTAYRRRMPMHRVGFVSGDSPDLSPTNLRQARRGWSAPFATWLCAGGGALLAAIGCSSASDTSLGGWDYGRAGGSGMTLGSGGAGSWSGSGAQAPITRGVGTVQDRSSASCVPTCYPGVLSEVNDYVLHDDHQYNVDAQGRVLVGHDATFRNYAIGTQLPADPNRADLVVGNALDYQGGSVASGKVSYGGNLIASSAFALGGYHPERPVDFAVANQQMLDASATLAALRPTAGSATNGSMLVGTRSDLNVFEIPASAVGGGMTISAPAGSTVVVNITGGSVSLVNFSIFLQGGVDREHVVYNLPQASSLTIDGISIQGTLLAPLASTQFNNGNIDGQLIVWDLEGGGESHSRFFEGCLPLCECTPVKCSVACGLQADGCGHMIDCGSCDAGTSDGAGGYGGEPAAPACVDLGGTCSDATVCCSGVCSGGMCTVSAR